jgi:hypothetical protein
VYKSSRSHALEKPPSTCRLTHLLTTDQDGQAEGDRLWCMRLLAEAPSLAAAIAVARRLAKLRRRASEEQEPPLLRWLLRRQPGVLPWRGRSRFTT